MDTSALITEKRNDRTLKLDDMRTEDLLKIMNDEDSKVISAVREQIPQIKIAVDKIISALKNGGRLIYIGAGTSGRIGLLDAVECPPTFGVSPEKIMGLIAGGNSAFIKAVEGAEDNSELGVNDLKQINISQKDVVVGIAASGRTPYVIGGLEYANSIGALTIGLSCNKGSKVGNTAKIPIEVQTGTEVLTGSTRLKAGTAQKLVCNMLSTASMIGIGKVYENLMVDLQLTNEKLVERAKRIIMEATACDYETAEHYLHLAKNKPKIAIIMILGQVGYEESVERLERAEGFIRRAIE